MSTRIRVLVGLFCALAVGSVVAIATAASGSRTVTVKIPLPAANAVKVAVVEVTLSGPTGKRPATLKVSANNASELGTAAVNTQAIAAVAPQKSNAKTATFDIYVFIHHFPAAPGTSRHALAGSASDVGLTIEQQEYSREVAGIVVGSASCDQLAHEPIKTKTYSFLDDSWVSAVNSGLVNLVPGMTTHAEEQVDAAVYATGCPDAEQPDPGTR